MTAHRPTHGPGSRGGNVRSVEEARSLHEAHKPDWTALVRARMAERLLATGRFHADDLADLAIPEEHSQIHGGQVSSFLASGLMRATGERRKIAHKAANARKGNVYEITDKGRAQLVGVDAGVPNPQGPGGASQTVPVCASVDSDEPLSLLPAPAASRPLNPLTDAEAA